MGTTNLVRKFTQSLLLTPQNFLILLRIATSPSIARSLINFGVFVINGQPKTGLGYFIKPGDTMQIISSAFKDVNGAHFWRHKFKCAYHKISSIKFFQAD